MRIYGRQLRPVVPCGLLACWLLMRLRADPWEPTSDEPAPTVRSFRDQRWAWSNGEPGVNGAKGSWRLEDVAARTELVVVPTPQRDYWSNTFYDPLLVKNDAQTLLATVPSNVEATLTTAFTLKPVAQFDQAGIMVLVDESTWVKAGIEYTDGVPRLSCVVTNDGFSDWSTRALPPPPLLAVVGCSAHLSCGCRREMVGLGRGQQEHVRAHPRLQGAAGPGPRPGPRDGGRAVHRRRHGRVGGARPSAG